MLEENEVLTLLGSPTLTNIQYICDLAINKQIDIANTLLQIEQIKNNLSISTGDLLKIFTEFVVNNLQKENKVNDASSGSARQGGKSNGGTKSTLNITNILQKFGEIEIFMTSSFNDKLITALIIGIMKTY